VTDPDEPLENQARRFLVSQAVMLALAGVPAVYIHSLLGSRNDVEGMLALGHNRAINREQLDVDAVEQELAQPGSFRRLVFEPYQHLISVRRSQRAFHPNAPQMALDVGSAAVLALLRGDESTGRVLALHNLSGSTQPVRIAFGGCDLVSGAAVSAGSVMLEPYQVLWVAGDSLIPVCFS
jgi:glucosylglycerate phosphorylase